MGERSDIVVVLERDLQDFLLAASISEHEFCTANRMNKGFFGRLRQGKNPNIATIEKCYAIMDDAGFISVRRRRQWLVDEALRHKAGDNNLMAALEAVRNAG